MLIKADDSLGGPLQKCGSIWLLPPAKIDQKGKMMSKIKMKTRKAAAKRFKKATANGKILRSIRNHGHFLSKMGNKAHKLAGTTYVDDANFDAVNKLVPALGAKKKRTKFLKRVAEAMKQQNANA